MTNTLSRGRVLAIVLLCCGVIGFGQNQDGKDAVHPDVEKPPLVWPRVEIPAGFEQIAQIAISPDGRRALTTRNEGIPLVTLWNLDTGEVIRKERVSLSRIGLRSASVGLSPDGQHAFWVTPKDSQHELNLWHVESGRKVKTFAVSKKGVVAAAFSEDGKYLASADYDGLITLWEVVSGQAVRTFQGSRPSVVLFSPDGKYLLADELGQKAVWLWDRAGAKEPRKLPIAWFGGYWRVAFSSTGSNLLVGHSLGPIQVLDLPSGQAVAEVLAGRWVFAPLPDGKHLVLGGQPREGLKLVDLATGKVTRTSERVRHAPDQIVVSGDGRRVLYSSGDFLMLWDLEKGEKVRMLARGPRHPDPITQLAFLSDNKRLVVSRKEDVTLWDAERGKEIHKFDLGPLHNVAVRIVPDGKAVLIDGWEENRREVGLWDVATGKPLWKLTGGRGYGTLGISPDSRLFLAYALPHLDPIQFQLRELKTGKLVRSLVGYKYPPASVAFSPDGKLAVSADGTMPVQEILLWDLASGKVIRPLQLLERGDYLSMAFSPDGKQVLAHGWFVKAAWDVTSGKLVQSSVPEAEAPRVMAYSADQKHRLEAKGDDLFLRTVADKEVVSKFAFERKHREEQRQAVAISPDSQFVVAGGDLGTLNLWEAATGKLLWKVIDDEVVPPPAGGWNR